MFTWNHMPPSRSGREIASKSGQGHKRLSTCVWISQEFSGFRRTGFAYSDHRWEARLEPKHSFATRLLLHAWRVRRGVQLKSCWIATRNGLRSIATPQHSASKLALAPTARLFPSKSSAGSIQEPMQIVGQAWHRRWGMQPLDHIVFRMCGSIHCVSTLTCLLTVLFVVTEQPRRSGLQNARWTFWQGN